MCTITQCCVAIVLCCLCIVVFLFCVVVVVVVAGSCYCLFCCSQMRHVFLVVDVSRSMMEKDLKPDRKTCVLKVP